MRGVQYGSAATEITIKVMLRGLLLAIPDSGHPIFKLVPYPGLRAVRGDEDIAGALSILEPVPRGE